MNLMNFLSRILTRTPSLRARVVLATAIGAAIPVLIVGTVVWVGITNDRKERLDRRLDQGGGFGDPLPPAGPRGTPAPPHPPRRHHDDPPRQPGQVEFRRDAAPAERRLRRHLRPRSALPGADGG